MSTYYSYPRECSCGKLIRDIHTICAADCAETQIVRHQCHRAPSSPLPIYVTDAEDEYLPPLAYPASPSLSRHVVYDRGSLLPMMRYEGEDYEPPMRMPMLSLWAVLENEPPMPPPTKKASFTSVASAIGKGLGVVRRSSDSRTRSTSSSSSGSSRSSGTTDSHAMGEGFISIYSPQSSKASPGEVKGLRSLFNSPTSISRKLSKRTRANSSDLPRGTQLSPAPSMKKAISHAVLSGVTSNSPLAGAHSPPSLAPAHADPLAGFVFTSERVHQRGDGVWNMPYVRSTELHAYARLGWPVQMDAYALHQAGPTPHMPAPRRSARSAVSS
jgi:hypothetical protein